MLKNTLARKARILLGVKKELQRVERSLLDS